MIECLFLGKLHLPRIPGIPEKIPLYDLSWKRLYLHDLLYIFWILILKVWYKALLETLPVRKYLVPTPSTKGGGGGGGVEPTPHDFENGRLYNLQLWQAIRTIYER